jgi:hypothetical protein
MTSQPSVTGQEESPRRLKVIEGIDLLFGLFERAGQRPFPRKIMTAKSNGQIEINGKHEMLEKFEAADFNDCRVNAYPSIPRETLQIPNIIPIDLDINRSLKTAQKQIDKLLDKTLQNISECTDNSTIPLVLWTGNGYHVIVSK